VLHCSTSVFLPAKEEVLPSYFEADS